VSTWTETKKRRGVLSPEQVDFKARRLKAIARRQRAYLRKQVGTEASDGDVVGDGFDTLFD
jgi:hypothetical protein